MILGRRGGLNVVVGEGMFWRCNGRGMTGFPRDQPGEIKKCSGAAGTGRRVASQGGGGGGFCAVTLIWRTGQGSPDHSEYAPPSPDQASPHSAGKPELAAKWPLLAAGPGPGCWWHHRPVAVAPLSVLCTASASSLTLLEGGSGLTTAGTAV